MIRVIKVRGRKKRYTRCLEPVQRLEAGCVGAVDSLARAGAAGFYVYRELEEESALSKRDGAIRDAVANVFVGSAVASVASLAAPVEFINGLAGGKPYRKLGPVPVPPPFNFFT